MTYIVTQNPIASIANIASNTQVTDSILMSIRFLGIPITQLPAQNDFSSLLANQNLNASVIVTRAPEWLPANLLPQPNPPTELAIYPNHANTDVPVQAQIAISQAEYDTFTLRYLIQWMKRVVINVSETINVSEVVKKRKSSFLAEALGVVSEIVVRTTSIPIFTSSILGTLGRFVTDVGLLRQIIIKKRPNQ